MRRTQSVDAFSLERRFENTHVEATLNHRFPAPGVRRRAPQGLREIPDVVGQALEAVLDGVGAAGLRGVRAEGRDLVGELGVVVGLGPLRFHQVELAAERGDVAADALLEVRVRRGLALLAELADRVLDDAELLRESRDDARLAVLLRPLRRVDPGRDRLELAAGGVAGRRVADGLELAPGMKGRFVRRLSRWSKRERQSFEPSRPRARRPLCSSRPPLSASRGFGLGAPKARRASPQ